MDPAPAPPRSNAWRAGVLLAGTVALALGPVMVAIKYLTGWRIIPVPWWVDALGAMESLQRLGPATRLWTAFGSVYAVALAVLLAGLVRWRGSLGGETGTAGRLAHGVAVLGLAMTVMGDAVHSWLWYRTGIAIPTPGSDPLPNRAYAVHMMGMNLFMLGTLALGIVRLRARSAPQWLSWGLVAILPAAVLASVTWLPTTPSGALWWFHLLMMLLAARDPGLPSLRTSGASVERGASPDLVGAPQRA